MDCDELRDQYKIIERNLRENMERLLVLSAHTDKKIQQLQEEKFKQSVLQAKMAENARNARDMITLDVGGTVFRTTKATLLRMEGGYFHVMLASGEWLPNENGTM
jgi:hypothetical protein